MDDVRVFKITLYFVDGSIRVFDEDAAFWGTHAQASRMAEMMREGYTMKLQKVWKWEIEEID